MEPKNHKAKRSKGLRDCKVILKKADERHQMGDYNTQKKRTAFGDVFQSLLGNRHESYLKGNSVNHDLGLSGP